MYRENKVVKGQTKIIFLNKTGSLSVPGALHQVSQWIPEKTTFEGFTPYMHNSHLGQWTETL